MKTGSSTEVQTYAFLRPAPCAPAADSFLATWSAKPARQIWRSVLHWETEGGFSWGLTPTCWTMKRILQISVCITHKNLAVRKNMGRRVCIVTHTHCVCCGFALKIFWYTSQEYRFQKWQTFQKRGFFCARKNSCRTCYYGVKGCKEFGCKALWLNCKLNRVFPV